MKLYFTPVVAKDQYTEECLSEHSLANQQVVVSVAPIADLSDLNFIRIWLDAGYAGAQEEVYFYPLDETPDPMELLNALAQKRRGRNFQHRGPGIDGWQDIYIDERNTLYFEALR